MIRYRHAPVIRLISLNYFPVRLQTPKRRLQLARMLSRTVIAYSDVEFITNPLTLCGTVVVRRSDMQAHVARIQ